MFLNPKEITYEESPDSVHSSDSNDDAIFLAKEISNVIGKVNLKKEKLRRKKPGTFS